MNLNQMPFLEVSIEDFHEAKKMSRIISPKNKRHSVLLFEDSMEFLFYQKLCLINEDIYKNGQNTIGFDKALEIVKEKSGLLFLDVIRRVQKLRGDIKHHAQEPSDKEYESMLDKIDVFYSAFIYENFWEDLKENIFEIKLLPYHEALYTHSVYIKSHRPEEACLQILAACIHKLKAFIKNNKIIKSWLIKDRGNLIAVLQRLLIENQVIIIPEVFGKIQNEINGIKSLSDEFGLIFDKSIKIFGMLDEILPSFFEINSSIKITDRLLIPKKFSYKQAMSWAKFMNIDTKTFFEYQRKIHDLLNDSKELVSLFGPLYREEEEDNYWEWWEFAVFDGNKWYSVHLESDFDLLPESGDWQSSIVPERRETITKVVYEELLKAKNKLTPKKINIVDQQLSVVRLS
jgi:hypothetical protein